MELYKGFVFGSILGFGAFGFSGGFGGCMQGSLGVLVSVYLVPVRSSSSSSSSN